jgi:hypothetical protein
MTTEADRLAAVERRCDSLERTTTLLAAELTGMRTATTELIKADESKGRALDALQEAYAAAAQRADYAGQALHTAELKAERTAATMQRRIHDLERQLAGREPPAPPPLPVMPAPDSPAPLLPPYARPR